jgi:tRNA G18 (ribose-2'-O)-methylase SpoU
MPRVSISDITDPRLEPFRHLKDTNLTRWSGLFVVEGEKLVRRLLASRYPIVSVLLSESFVDQIAGEIPADVSVLIIPDALVDGLVGFNFHRGVLACGRRISNPPLEHFIGTRNKPLTFVVCPDVQDPENLGAILRISAAFGVDGVLLGSRCADPLSRRVLRVSMGAVLRLPLIQSNDLQGDLSQLREQWQVQLAATVLDTSAEPLAKCRRTERLALLFGSEGHGLEQSWLDACDRRITIPMSDGVDSLNVAVAAGIFLHHFTRVDVLETGA